MSWPPPLTDAFCLVVACLSFVLFEISSPDTCVIKIKQENLFKTCYYLIIMHDYRNQKSDIEIIEAFRRKGYKATPQRIAICRFILGSREHPSAKRIYDEVKVIHSTVSLATVYKTLQILKELGQIQELGFPQGESRFDSNVKPHINLVCIKCGNIQDLDDHIAKEIVERVSSVTKFTAKEQRLDIYGICEKCSKGAKGHR
jgi:Fur family peroxide stress response transcriptional regulator